MANVPAPNRDYSLGVNASKIPMSSSVPVGTGVPVIPPSAFTLQSTPKGSVLIAPGAGAERSYLIGG